jgi:hypothetical protein
MPRLKEGTRVVLISSIHGNSLQNPVWGDAYGCEGTLGYQDNTEYIYKIDWDNKCSNSYREGELQAVKSKYVHPFTMQEEDSLWTV